MSPALLAALLVTGASPSLALRAQGAPEGCALEQAAAEELRARVPDLALGPEGELTATLAPGQSRWTLELRTRDGRLALARELPAMAPACDELARWCALVLERYLSELTWSGPPAQLSALPKVEQAPPAPARPSLQLHRPQAALAAGLLYGPGADPQPAASVQAALRLGARGRLEAHLLAARGTERTLSVAQEARGVARSVPVLALVGGGACAGERLLLCGAALAGASISAVSVDGRFYRTRPGLSVLPAAGLSASAAYAHPAGFTAGLTALAIFPLGTQRFEVEGATPALESPRAQLGALLGLGWAFP